MATPRGIDYIERMKPLRSVLSPWLLAIVVLLNTGAAWANRPRLVVLPAPRAVLSALNNDSTERFACLYGVHSGNLAVVTHAEPGVPSRESRGGRFWITEIHCPPGALGLAHNHPYGERCYFFFPTTVVPTADYVSFLQSGQPLSVIVCRERLVWVMS